VPLGVGDGAEDVVGPGPAVPPSELPQAARAAESRTASVADLVVVRIVVPPDIAWNSLHPNDAQVPLPVDLTLGVLPPG
jgi:hypothetical protein